MKRGTILTKVGPSEGDKILLTDDGKEGWGGFEYGYRIITDYGLGSNGRAPMSLAEVRAIPVKEFGFERWRRLMLELVKDDIRRKRDELENLIAACRRIQDVDIRALESEMDHYRQLMEDDI